MRDLNLNSILSLCFKYGRCIRLKKWAQSYKIFAPIQKYLNSYIKIHVHNNLKFGQSKYFTFGVLIVCVSYVQEINSYNKGSLNQCCTRSKKTLPDGLELPYLRLTVERANHCATGCEFNWISNEFILSCIPKFSLLLHIYPSRRKFLVITKISYL